MNQKLSHNIVRRAGKLCLTSAGLGLVCLMSLACQKACSSTTVTATNQANQQEGAMDADQGFEIWYSADNGRPQISASLHIFPNGTGELYLGTSWSLPYEHPDTVGTFQGSISPDRLVTLRRFISDEDIMDLKIEQPPGLPATIRGLSVKYQGKEKQLTLIDVKPGSVLDKLEQLLMKIMAELSTQPLRAAQVTLIELKKTNESFQPMLNIKNVGQEALPISIYDLEATGQLLRITTTLEQAVSLPGGSISYNPLKEEEVPREFLMSLFSEGKLPTGRTQLAPGRSIQLALPQVSLPPEKTPLFFSCTVMFWLPGIGPELRIASVQPRRLKLAQATALPKRQEQQPPTDNRLRLTIESKKEKFAVDDPITLTVALHNEDTKPISVVGRFLINHEGSPVGYRDLYFTIQGPTGYEEQRLFLVKAGSPQQTDVVLLPPGGVHSKQIQLATYHSLHLPGRYTITAHYTNVVVFPNIEIWQGQLQSNPLVLERR